MLCRVAYQGHRAPSSDGTCCNRQSPARLARLNVGMAPVLFWTFLTDAVVLT